MTFCLVALNLQAQVLILDHLGLLGVILGVDEAVIDPQLGQLVQDRPLVANGDDVLLLLIRVLAVVEAEDVDRQLGPTLDLCLVDVNGLVVFVADEGDEEEEPLLVLHSAAHPLDRDDFGHD